MTGANYFVSDTVQFGAALKSAAASGGTITLAPGDYGRLFMSNISNPGLTILSADPSNPAHFDGIGLGRVSNVTFANLDVGRALASGESLSTAFITAGGARNVAFVGLNVHGSMDGNASNDGYGMRLDGCTDVTVAQSHFEQLDRACIVMRSSDMVLTGNEVTATREGFGICAVDHLVIEKNLIHDLSPDFSLGDHPDCIQFMTAGMGSTSHVLIRDNAMINGADAAVQGIFMRSTEPGTYGYSDFTIDNNLYYGGSRHGITVGYCDGLTVTHNTILASPDPTLVPALNVTSVSNAVFADNISPLWLVDGAKLASFGSNDLTVLNSKSPAGMALDALFATPPTGTDPALDAFVQHDGITAGFVAVDGIGGSDGDPIAMLGSFDALHALAMSLGSAPLLG